MICEEATKNFYHFTSNLLPHVPCQIFKGSAVTLTRIMSQHLTLNSVACSMIGHRSNS